MTITQFLLLFGKKGDGKVWFPFMSFFSLKIAPNLNLLLIHFFSSKNLLSVIALLVKDKTILHRMTIFNNKKCLRFVARKKKIYLYSPGFQFYAVWIQTKLMHSHIFFHKKLSWLTDWHVTLETLSLCTPLLIHHTSNPLLTQGGTSSAGKCRWKKIFQFSGTL